MKQADFHKLWRQKHPLGILLTVWLLFPGQPASASPSPPSQPSPSPPIRPRMICPTEVAPLLPLLLRDLPDYQNRLNQRLLGKRSRESFTYAIAASQPDFTPMPIVSREAPSPVDPNLHQVFFTVLERQYVGNQTVEWQQYHWLFLTHSDRGWRVALLFSRLGSYPDGKIPPTPPRDSSQGVTAQAIRLWLRDCHGGAISQTSSESPGR